MVDSCNTVDEKSSLGDMLKCCCCERKVISPGQVIAEQRSTGGNPMSVYLSVGTAMTVSIAAVANAAGLNQNGLLTAELRIEEVSTPAHNQSLALGQHSGPGELSVPLAAIVALRATVSYVIRFDDGGHDNRSGTNHLTVAVVSAP